MSRSSVPDGAAGTDRGQVDPLPALVAVGVVGLAVSLYAVGLEGLPGTGGDERATAEVTLGAVCERVCDGGQVDPERLEEGLAAAPDGHRVRIVLRADGREWTAGPAPPETGATTTTAARTVTVQLGPTDVSAGRLRVVVWE